MIFEEGEYSNITVGNDLEKDQFPQYVVKGGCWFTSEVTIPDSFGLVGCTVSPGFDFDDFELSKRVDLIRNFPQHKEIIARLTNQ